MEASEVDALLAELLQTVSYDETPDWRAMPELGEEPDGQGLTVFGGPGSGNFGHTGRPGEVGGSGEGAHPHLNLPVGTVVASSKLGKVEIDTPRDGKPRYRARSRNGQLEKTDLSSIQRAQEVLERGFTPGVKGGEVEGRTRREVQWKTLGGQGSGNFGHAGRPGEIGGSAAGGGLREKGQRAGRQTLDKIWQMHRQGVPVAKIQRELGFRHQPHVHQIIKKLKAEREGAIRDVAKVLDMPAARIEQIANPALAPFRERMEVPPPANVANVPAGAPIKISPEGSDINNPTPIHYTEKKDISAGVNQTYKVTTPEGQVYAFKPREGELWGIRQTVKNKSASLAEREVLTSRIDQALNLGVVPRTTMVRLSDGTVGSAQEWVSGKVPRDFSSLPKDQVARMAILDAVIGNTDRHPGNLMQAWKEGDKAAHGENRAPTGRLHAIDHGYVFSTATENVELRSWALGKIRDGDLTHNEMREIAGKLKNTDWGELLRGSHLDRHELAALQVRTAKVISHLEGRDLRGLRTFKPKTDYIARNW